MEYFYHCSIYEDVGDYNHPNLNSRDSRKSKDAKKDKRHYFEKTSHGESHVSVLLIFFHFVYSVIFEEDPGSRIFRKLRQINIEKTTIYYFIFNLYRVFFYK
jgi:hypothetical protein